MIKASPDQLLRSLTSPNRSSEPPKPNSYPNSQWQQILKRTPETFKSDGEAERLSGDSGNRRPVAAPSRARTLPPRVEEPEQDDLDVEEDEEEDEEDIGEEEQDGQQERRAVSRAQAVDSGKYGLIRDPKTRQDFWLVLRICIYIYISLSLSIYLFIYLFNYLSIYLSS